MGKTRLTDQGPNQTKYGQKRKMHSRRVVSCKNFLTPKTIIAYMWVLAKMIINVTKTGGRSKQLTGFTVVARKTEQHAS